MPSRGGAAGKAGDQYEALWTVDAALRVIEGYAEHVTYESLAPEQSRGVEFKVETATRKVEFWSLKRQTTSAAGWTLATLTRRDEHGRSILGDLAAHVDRDARYVGVFASTLGAANLEEMRSVAATADSLQQRLDQSAELKAQHDKYLLPLFRGDRECTRQFLTRLQIRTADETSLRTQIESRIALLFYPEIGGSVDARHIRRLLAEYLIDQMHQQIDRKMLLDHLATHGLRRRDWKVDPTIREKVDALCDAYTRPLCDQLIGGTLQKLPGADKLLGPDDLPVAWRTLISGGAGAGKSSELACVIERLRAAGVPVLPVRMDSIHESILTPQRLGEELSLPASPAAVLAGLADGGHCVLVIDQLDAVSLASGRRADVWSLFERILVEADGYPNLRVIVACRAFDLEHDHRMRSLKAETSTFEVVTIQSFPTETVDEILDERKVHPKLRPVLIVPLHLAMFLSLEHGESERLETRDQLFAAFWTEKQQQCTQRLGRSCNLAAVVDWLTQWLSDQQELSAPASMLPDEFRPDADALASENVLVLADGRYRFFHETFFDYAFARRFVQKGGSLLNLLLSSEQHLFRRAQVRQVLSFLRSTDSARYGTELRSVLTETRVRFHIKRVVLQFISTTPDPTHAEWTVLRELEAANPDLLHHVNRVISNHVGWFDRLDEVGFLESGLSSRGSQRGERVVWLCAMPEVLKHRSTRVAALLRQYRCNDEAWTHYLRYICRGGDVFHSREIFNLFLSLIRDGTLDDTRPGVAVNDNWWSTLYSMCDKAPTMAAEAIAAWVDRKLQVWQPTHAAPIPSGLGTECRESEVRRTNIRESESRTSLSQHFDQDGDDHGVIVKTATGSPMAFVEQLLPRVAEIVSTHSKPCRDHLDSDPLWCFRSYGDDAHQVHVSLLTCLARALEALAVSAPDDLDRMFSPYMTRSNDTIAYLVLRAWSAASARYADRLARYLVEDPRRLKVGYASWGAGAGMASDYRSIEAVRAASQACSQEAFSSLESTIVDLRDEWESRNPPLRGLRQLQLLAAMDQSRLGAVGRAKLAELRAKFPDATYERPRPSKFVCVGSPVPAEAMEKMTDDQWLSAMAKYAGVEHRRDRDIEASGGERQLAQSLESMTKAQPKRFAALTQRMSVGLPASYFDAILQGLAATESSVEASGNGVTLSDAVSLIVRIHALPGRPCGRSITHLVEKWTQLGWPESIVDIVAWYATEDPDPSEEAWRKPTPSGQVYYGGDPDMAGLNSTRGIAAYAISALLFATHPPTDVLIKAIDRLAHDPSIAVRAQAVRALLALLSKRPDLAIPWFVECISLDAVLLKTPLVEHFVHYAGHRDYAALRPIIQNMIASDDAKTVKVGSKLCCLLALNIDMAKEDAAQVRIGTPAMREASATIYATNIANKEVGASCRELLLPFFADPSDNVRAKAATAFRRIAELATREQADLLGAFLDSNPSATALEPVIHALEDSPVRLPDLVCRLAEAGVEQFKTNAGDIRTRGAMVASDLSKIVIRLYTQSDDDALKTRCLNTIDTMEHANFYGLSDELGRVER